MIKTSDELLAFLCELGIEGTTSEHAHVRTVAESRELRGGIAGIHTKNLFLRDAKRRYYLIVTDEKVKVDLKALGGKIGASGKLSFASPEVLREILGVEPGAVSLLALVNDTERKATLVLDEALRTAPIINCHPLASNRTTSLSSYDVARFIAATGHGDCGAVHDRDVNAGRSRDASYLAPPAQIRTCTLMHTAPTSGV